MEDYYIKYAKPLDNLSIKQVQSRLKEWEKNTKEEIDLLIFITNGVKNESLNSLSQSIKINILSILDQLKSFCINVLNKLCELLRAIEMNFIIEIDHQFYADIELTRNDYNIQLKNNQKTIVSSEILIDLKDKFYKMKKVLNEPRDAYVNDGIYYNDNKRYSSKEKKNKFSSKSRIPRLDLNMIKDPLKRDINTNNNFCLYKNMSVHDQRANEVNGCCNDHDRDKGNNNHEYDTCNNSNMTYIRPISQRDKHSLKYTKTQSYDNVFDTLHCNNKAGNHNHNHKNRINAKTAASTIDSYQIMQNDIITMQKEISKLKEKNKKSKDIPQSLLNNEYVLKLQNQNNQMWNEMSNMRKDICELTNTVRILTQKINEITEDNNKINRHNEKLTQYIRDLTQHNTVNHNEAYNNQTNNNNYSNIINDNASSFNYNKYNNSHTNIDTIIHSIPMDNQYFSDYNGRCDSNNESPKELDTNENEISQDYLPQN